jgi:ADP-ribose pyrophosphatase
MNTALEPWTRLTRRVIYDSFLKVVSDQVRMPTGKEIQYDSIDQGDCSCVLVLTASKQILLLRQFRYVTSEVTWEIPMGGVHPGENPETAARRELVEETGYTVQELLYLGSIVPSNGQSPQRMHLYFAPGAVPGKSHPEDTELLEVHHVDTTFVMRLIENGEISDAATLTAILLAERRHLL